MKNDILMVSELIDDTYITLWECSNGYVELQVRTGSEITNKSLYDDYDTAEFAFESAVESALAAKQTEENLMNTYILPDWTICPLVNDDWTGLEDSECELLEAFLRSLPEDGRLAYIDSVGFRLTNDLNKLGDDCSSFVLV